MYRFRIYTEDKNRVKILEFVNRFFDGFTIIPAIGHWRGGQENCLIIEIITDKKKAKMIYFLVDMIKEYNYQESILLTTDKITVNFV